MDNNTSSSNNYKIAKIQSKKKTKLYDFKDVLNCAWIVKTFDEDRFIKVSMTGLFVKIGNFSDFRTIEELYPTIRNVVDSKGLIVAKRKNIQSNLNYIKHKGIKIPV